MDLRPSGSRVADLVLLLASDRAGNVTGADFVIDPFAVSDRGRAVRVPRARAERFHPRKVVLRLLELGGDKILPYFPLPPSRNPSLALRGVRGPLGGRDGPSLGRGGRLPEPGDERSRAIRVATAGVDPSAATPMP